MFVAWRIAQPSCWIDSVIARRSSSKVKRHENVTTPFLLRVYCNTTWAARRLVFFVQRILDAGNAVAQIVYPTTLQRHLSKHKKRFNISWQTLGAITCIRLLLTVVPKNATHRRTQLWSLCWCISMRDAIEIVELHLSAANAFVLHLPFCLNAFLNIICECKIVLHCWMHVGHQLTRLQRRMPSQWKYMLHLWMHFWIHI